MRGGGVAWNMSSTCIQGSIPRPLGGYQPNLIMEPHSPAPAWQLHHPILPKQEPMDEDRNDSGINSGSDFHSSSPGSENSQDYNPAITYSSSQSTRKTPTSTYYSTPLISRMPSTSPMEYPANVPLHLGYQPVTPPNLMQVPQQPINSTNNFIDNERSNTPPSEHHQIENLENEDPLRRLQFTLEKNGLVAPSILSPKTSEHSADEDNKSDLDGEEYDEQGLRTPRMNSHGKVKTHKCKQCDFVAITKMDFWDHSKVHINPDKLLTCPKCPFVTEYKHHLEYHLRNHFGSKPFKCDKCSYTCVNKSMLNSHMKSHSNIYQYRCTDCSYATKYCHSLKLHLRKYAHKPAMVLHPDGTPNPLPIIDVYGTRRGPKQKSNKCEDSVSPSTVLQNQFTHMMLNASPQMQIPFPYHFLAGFQNPLSNPLLLPPGLESLAQQLERSRSPEEVKAQEEIRTPNRSPTSILEQEQQTAVALDLSKPESNCTEQQPKNRRKGRAFKLENLRVNDSSEDEDVASTVYTEKRTTSSPQKSPELNKEEVINNNNVNNSTSNFDCSFCNISFGDIILYTMHMGYHGFKDPFTCNMCGEQCKDKVSFFLHIARNPHT